MKLQQTLNVNVKNQKQDGRNENTSPVAFKGGEGLIQFLNFLDTNQTMGATFVDVGCMGVPRSAVDFTRGPEAGVETMRREFSSTINDALLGAYGLGAAWLLSKGFNNKFNVQAHKMFITDEMLDILSNIWKDNKGSKESLKEFLSSVFAEAKGFNPDIEGCDTNGWIGIDAKTQKEVVDEMFKAINDKPQNLAKETKAYLKALISDATGAESKFKLEKQIGKDKVKSVSSLDDLIGNLYKMSKNFMSDKVADAFKTGEIKDNIFVKGLKNLNIRNSIVGLAASILVGISIQPLNMYLTKKKTGKEGFVGVEGREPDKSNKFKLMKIGVATAAAVAALLTISTSPKQILKNIQFKGFIPTIDQFKLVYGATIVSRLLSARDKNELRESSIKDSLGFTNWLIFGGFVSKLAAMGFDKMAMFKNNKFIRYNEAETGKGFFNRLLKSSTVTREEVLHSAFKKMGISSIKENGLAMSFKEMIKKLKDTSAKSVPEAIAALRKTKYLGFIQFAGYLYSGIVLGMGIPKLNIAITNAVENKRKAQQAQKAA